MSLSGGWSVKRSGKRQRLTRAVWLGDEPEPTTSSLVCCRCSGCDRVIAIRPLAVYVSRSDPKVITEALASGGIQVTTCIWETFRGLGRCPHCLSVLDLMLLGPRPWSDELAALEGRRCEAHIGGRTR